MSSRMTKEYRLRKALASLVASLQSHEDHSAVLTALRAVNPEAASRLAAICLDSEAATGQLLGMGYSDDTEFSVLDKLIVGDPSKEIPRLERMVTLLVGLQSKFGSHTVRSD